MKTIRKGNKNLTRILVTITTAIILITTITMSATADSTKQWSSFRKDMHNNAVLSSEYKYPTNNLSAAEIDLKGEADYVLLSDPVAVDVYIFIAADDTLYKIDIETEKTIASYKLSESIGYTCRLAASADTIFIPLSGGRIEAISKDDGTSLWVSNSIVEYYVKEDYELDSESVEYYNSFQSLSTLTLCGDYLLFGVSDADWSSTYMGVLICIDTKTGDVNWLYENSTLTDDDTASGYYWSGFTVVEGPTDEESLWFDKNDTAYQPMFAIIGDDRGNLATIEVISGEIMCVYNAGNGASIRSTCVYDGGHLYFTTTDGYLHKVKINEYGQALDDSGQVISHKRISFAAYSTSTPVIYNNTAYVGGHMGEEGSYAGTFAAINTESMTTVYSSNLPAEVKASPLVYDTGENGVYAYFTSNTTPGCAYVYNDSSINKLYIPTDEKQNYCMASVQGHAGKLFYTNDSGTLFILSASTDTPVETTEATTEVSTETTVVSTTDNTENKTEGTTATTPSTIAATGSSSVKGSGSSYGDNVKTGSTSHILPLLLLVLSAAGTVVILRKRADKN